MKVLAVIPARAGSKGITNKNMASLAGRPLIDHTIKAASQCRELDRIIVSTDSEEIATHCRKLNVEVPFLRPAELAKDDTPDLPVFEHALDYLKDENNYTPDFVIQLRPTSPFRHAEDITAVISIWRERDFDCVRTMTEVHGVHHPYWMFRSEDNQARPFSADIRLKDYYQRQLLPSVLRLNGMVDGFKPSNVFEKKSLWAGTMGVVVTAEERSLDIDTPMDLKIANCIMENKL